MSGHFAASPEASPRYRPMRLLQSRRLRPTKHTVNSCDVSAAGCLRCFSIFPVILQGLMLWRLRSMRASVVGLGAHEETAQAVGVCHPSLAVPVFRRTQQRLPL